MQPESDPDRREPFTEARDSVTAEWLFAGVEAVIYLVVGAMLAVAGALILGGTVLDVIDRVADHSVTNTAIFVLARILLLFIIAELLHTLRLVNVGGRILAEPFLFIGLIAVVRRILIVTAEFETTSGRSDVTDLVIQVGALGGLALLLAVAIYLLRKGRESPPVAADA